MQDQSTTATTMMLINQIAQVKINRWIASVIAILLLILCFHHYLIHLRQIIRNQVRSDISYGAGLVSKIKNGKEALEYSATTTDSPHKIPVYQYWLIKQPNEAMNFSKQQDWEVQERLAKFLINTGRKPPNYLKELPYVIDDEEVEISSETIKNNELRDFQQVDFIKSFPNSLMYHQLRSKANSENDYRADKNFANPRAANENEDLVIIILTARKNYNQRQGIRQTWAKGFKNYFFIVGDTFCPFVNQVSPLSIQNYLEADSMVNFKWKTRLKNKEISEYPTFHTCNRSPIEADFLELWENYPYPRDNNTNQHYRFTKSYGEFLANKYRKLYEEEEKGYHRLNLEMEEYKDILILENQTDSYNNLTMKMLKSMIWAHDRFPNAKYFMKVDDDSYVKINALKAVIEEYANKMKREFPPMYRQHCFTAENQTKDYCHLYIGKTYTSEVTQTGKWADYDYNKTDHYPNYANGCSGYLISRNMVSKFRERYIGDESTTNPLFLYKNEDASIGIWLREDSELSWQTKIINSYVFSQCKKDECLGPGTLEIDEDGNEYYRTHDGGLVPSQHYKKFKFIHRYVAYGHGMDDVQMMKCHENVIEGLKEKNCFSKVAFTKQTSCFMPVHLKIDLLTNGTTSSAQREMRKKQRERQIEINSKKPNYIKRPGEVLEETEDSESEFIEVSENNIEK